MYKICKFYKWLCLVIRISNLQLIWITLIRHPILLHVKMVKPTNRRSRSYFLLPCWGCLLKVLSRYKQLGWILVANVLSRYLVKFLAHLAAQSDDNKMTPSNIAIVMGPNLMWPPGDRGWEYKLSLFFFGGVGLEMGRAKYESIICLFSIFYVQSR